MRKKIIQQNSNYSIFIYTGINSDGVLAIIITIMVLELKPPHGSNLEALVPLAKMFLNYTLSFLYVGIYWNNHHHLIQSVHHVNGKILWANTHLLFWLSLLPFATSWAGEAHYSSEAVCFYGFILGMAGVAYFILTQQLIQLHGQESKLAKAIGSDFKGKISVVLYILAMGIAFLSPFASVAIYLFVAFIWLVPDSRLEKLEEVSRR